MYLTYDEYLDMGGTIDDDATFYDFEFEARSIIDWYTFNRLKKQQEYPEEVKRCVYKLISMIQQKQSAQTMGLGDASNGGSTVAVASQSNDGVSVSYNVLSASEIVANSKSEMENVVRTYLNGVVNSLGRLLLYRGVYFDE